MTKTREEVLAEIAEREIAKEQAQDTVRGFLSEEGVGEAVLKVRNDVYDEFLKVRIADNPRLANDEGTFKAIYGMALDQYEAKKKAPVVEKPVTTTAAPAAPATPAAPASPAPAKEVTMDAADFEAYKEGKNLTASDEAALRNQLLAAGIVV